LKLQARLAEAEETIESMNQRANMLEKTKQRLTTHLEDSSLEVDRFRTLVSQLEKKQIYFDKILQEWKNKVTDLTQVSIFYFIKTLCKIK
jgi:chromosome segregation ATPase